MVVLSTFWQCWSWKICYWTRSLNDSWYTSENQDGTWKSSRWRGKSSEPSISIFGCHVITVLSTIHLSSSITKLDKTIQNHQQYIVSMKKCYNYYPSPIPTSNPSPFHILHCQRKSIHSNYQFNVPFFEKTTIETKDLHIPCSNTSFCQTLQVTNPFEANLLQTSDICQKPMTCVNPGSM